MQETSALFTSVTSRREVYSALAFEAGCARLPAPDNPCPF